MPRPGGRPVLRGKRRHLRPDLFLHGPGERLPVQHASAHATTPFSNALTLSVVPSTTSSSPACMIGLRRRVEFHGAAGPLDPDDDHAELLTDAGIDDALVGERRIVLDVHLLHRQVEPLGARGQLDEVDHGRPERRLHHVRRADLVRRDDAVRAALAAACARRRLIPTRAMMKRSGRMTRAVSTVKTFSASVPTAAINPRAR